MALIFKEIPGWTFGVDEVSANVFRVTGQDAAGHLFEKSGLDPDHLLDEAKNYALSVSQIRHKNQANDATS